MRLKLSLCLILMWAGALSSWGQYVLPRWVQSPPPSGNTYYYRVSQGDGTTEEASQKKAFAIAVLESAFAIGVPLNLQQLEQLEGDSLLVEANRYVKIPINKVCQHTVSLTTRQGYRTYILCQVAKDVHMIPDFKSFNCILNQEE
ncbi:MAG TPA: hypothetical protein H9824_00555 [Candidatus Bacteroides pullicola]|uniref:Uncharacterized protein n=1 Tax=Candidatus Bacteroides pullicola TaxID=2838475 RepID=A0A9D1ZGN6_9BACE|nr:hypothetical protein [Candidatus Bacteroides pullicola]